jgi:hypothetical protein
MSIECIRRVELELMGGGGRKVVGRYVGGKAEKVGSRVLERGVCLL